MTIITFLQDHQQWLIALGVMIAGLALYNLLSKKSKELESLEREYEEIVQSGKQEVKNSVMIKTDE